MLWTIWLKKPEVNTGGTFRNLLGEHKGEDGLVVQLVSYVNDECRVVQLAVEEDGTVIVEQSGTPTNQDYEVETITRMTLPGWDDDDE